MNGVNVVTNIIEILVSGITGIAGGIGQGLSTLVEKIFFVTIGTGSDAVTTISVFGVMIVAFAGISLAIGLSRWVLRFLTSLGARNG